MDTLAADTLRGFSAHLRRPGRCRAPRRFSDKQIGRTRAAGQAPASSTVLTWLALAEEFLPLNSVNKDVSKRSTSLCHQACDGNMWQGAASLETDVEGIGAATTVAVGPDRPAGSEKLIDMCERQRLCEEED
ncbi:unnamed protein product [Pleuronectes platessa]|uniref:Uncharacterized protein n=1 Tax=Pleuronectes platessa TaxID=8262 RepID=A0A9N7YR57_PLEPL|nr:unnamed protein product [Pleuronectes platessa]